MTDRKNKLTQLLATGWVILASGCLASTADPLSMEVKSFESQAIQLDAAEPFAVECPLSFCWFRVAVGTEGTDDARFTAGFPEAVATVRDGLRNGEPIGEAGSLGLALGADDRWGMWGTGRGAYTGFVYAPQAVTTSVTVTLVPQWAQATELLGTNGPEFSGTGSLNGDSQQWKLDVIDTLDFSDPALSIVLEGDDVELTGFYHCGTEHGGPISEIPIALRGQSAEFTPSCSGTVDESGRAFFEVRGTGDYTLTVTTN